MRWLLDQGVPRTAAEILRAAGEDAIHTGEIGMEAAEDAAILERARLEERVVVTLDSDFHYLLALSGASTPSVVRVRIESLRAPAFVDLIKEVRAACESDLLQGSVISVTAENIRVRRLPLL